MRVAGRVRRTQVEHHGRPAIAIDNGAVRVVALARGGPRLVALRPAGEPAANLLGETARVWDVPWGAFAFFGGHRLWRAPEEPPYTYAPDTYGLRTAPIDGGLRLTGAVQPAGERKELDVVLGEGPELWLTHRLTNTNERPRRWAAWGLTIVPRGGVAVIPLPAGGEDASRLPDRSVVLWPYTRLDDVRLALLPDAIVVRANGGDPLKVGAATPTRRIGYLHDGRLLVIESLDPVADERPDLGANVEAYHDDEVTEIETLGELEELAPGATTTHRQRWIVRDHAADPADLDELRDAVLRA